jgi:predicted  nucleic acid-binding Zn-ribbon protein
VQTNQGKQYSDQARSLLSSLSSLENNRFAAREQQRDADSSQAMSRTIAVNLCLLALTAGLFLLIRFHERALERQAAQSRQALAERDSQLEKLIRQMSAAGDQTRAQIAVIEENARLLLEKYDGFLPPLGYACAQQIKEATAQLEQLRKDLLGHPEPNLHEKAA